VGAAIAAGSQLEKGICALFVIAATIRARLIISEKELVWGNKKFQYPRFRPHAIEIKIRTSPMRLVRAVIIPPARALGVW
jgi:hypothetical protein